jgi:molybdenum-dependent DNA-binding transcriptional regulator ModE
MEHGMDWDRLRVFLAVNEAGSFTRAGRTLGLSQSAVSRQMIALEEELGASLFHRHARGLVLTEPGVDFHGSVRDMAEKLALARARINEARERPEGPLRITTTVAFGTAWLLAAFVGVGASSCTGPDGSLDLICDSFHSSVLLSENLVSILSIRIRPVMGSNSK